METTMHKLAIASAAAAFLISGGFAAAQDAAEGAPTEIEGTIKQLQLAEAGDATITLEDGTVLILPKDLMTEELAEGKAVQFTYEVVQGDKLVLSATPLPDEGAPPAGG
jgi:hypothetical protein